MTPHWTLPSVEARWFRPGATPAAIARWFERRETASAAMPSRVDHYLRLDGDAAMGIKLREGQVEVKQRQREFGVIQPVSHVVGHMEGWRKWSFALADGGDDLVASLGPAPSWIGVRKQRRLRKYEITGNDRIQEIPVSEVPRQRCSLELATLDVAGRAWWSLALEAVGDEERLDELLLRVARHMLQDCPGSILDAQHSYGYPGWLAQRPWHPK